MVAYSFHRRFVDMIRDRDKTHTLRNARRRHARVGEQLQLYTGMRTKSCMLIGTAACDRFRGIYLKFSHYQSFDLFDVVETDPGCWRRVGRRRPIGDPDAFARSDGFIDIDDMGRWWFEVHGVTSWEGFLIGWSPASLVLPKARAI